MTAHVTVLGGPVVHYYCDTAVAYHTTPGGDTGALCQDDVTYVLERSVAQDTRKTAQKLPSDTYARWEIKLAVKMLPSLLSHRRYCTHQPL